MTLFRVCLDATATRVPSEANDGSLIIDAMYGAVTSVSVASVE